MVFNFRHFCFLALGLSLFSCGKGKLSSTPQRPNILLMISDDHAVQAISAYGRPISKLAPTPNIDRLAEEGVLFTQNFCANSICGPSRATILTGKHSHMNGFVKNDRTKFNGHQPTIANILQEEGYQTAVIGKWHLNTLPVGFDHYEILNDQGEYNNPDFMTKDTTIQRMGYVTDIITSLTKKWLGDREEKKPFFLMMNHKAPHRNWVPAERHYRTFEQTTFPVPSTYFDAYEGREAAGQQKMNIYRDAYEGHDLKMVAGVGSDSLLYDPWPHVFMERMTPEEQEKFLAAYRERNDDFYTTPRTEKEKAEWKLQRYLQDYLACVKSVDESVGEVLNYLEAEGLMENTIVIYTSDQGFFLGEHGWFDKRWMYEESFRMPLLMKSPFDKKQGMVVDQLTQNIDFAPTLLEMTGVDIPDEMQGKSFLGLLDGTSQDWRKSLYYHFYEFPGFHSVRAHHGVRTDRYKLMHFKVEDRWEMFDLEQDPEEIHNIYGDPAFAEVQQMMHQEFEKLKKEYQVPEEAQSKNKSSKS
ncbi:sulfatase [Persicobacter diffluens]|uniref:Sulfatase n=1 Tax=Persicobacter diffluens TaxID=981 RepID=A0AAN4W368_9BACT|nr:sulfatase [Persicobacter diffluens]